MAAVKIPDKVKKQIAADNSGLSLAKLAEKYGVSSSSARHILNPSWYEEFKKNRRQLKHDPTYVKKRRDQSLKYLYGISLSQYEVMLDKQNGKCACCNRDESEEKNGKTKHFCVDHNHKTKQVRGLLCHRCNRMIGSALENTKTLLNAIKYLESFDGNQL